MIANLSFAVGTGESVCILGGNGSGKSTLALLIAGVIKSSTGEISVGPDAENERARVGLVYQSPDNRLVALTVDKEVAFALENRAVPMSLMERRVATSLDAFGIEQLAARATTELSGGEKQLVSLASIIVDEPDVLLLDEPDSMLDNDARHLFEVALRDLRVRRPQLTEIRFCTDPQVAAQYDRVLVLHNGKLVADGRPPEILANHDNLVSWRLSAGKESARADSSHLAPRSGGGVGVEKLQLIDVDFGYFPERPVLRELSLTMPRGEIVTLSGPTGAGKSTLALLMCGLLQPQNGRVTLDCGGAATVSVAERPGTVVASFQFPERQFFLATCSEEVAFGPQNLGRNLSQSEIAFFLELVGLQSNEFAGRSPFSLSMGEKRRLAFACIVSMSPTFILFDEPTAGLDPVGIAEFQRLAIELQNRGTGIAIISHENELFNGLSDRHLRLGRDGKLTELERMMTVKPGLSAGAERP